MTNKTTKTDIRLRNTESVWRDASGGYVAEVRGLYDQDRGVHEWIRLGVYGSRIEALYAVLATRGS